MKARQLSMLAASQSTCLECRVRFVGLSKDAIKLWADELDWLDVPAVHWAGDRVYQQNIRFCSPECARDHEAREVALEIERIRAKNYGKYR